MWEVIKKPIYLAKKAGSITNGSGDEITTYSKPVPYHINVQPVSGYTDIQTYGKRVTKMYKALVGVLEFEGVFSEDDKVYLENATPLGETVNGQNANYVIVSVRPQYRAIQIYFEKIHKGE